MASGYELATKNFERAVDKLRQNLQYLTNKGLVGDPFISRQNKILQSLAAYQETMELILSDYELDLTEAIMGKSKEIETLQNRVTALEAICLIHGIRDFPSWLAKGKPYLVAEAIELNRLKMIQVPFAIRKRTKKNYQI